MLNLLFYILIPTYRQLLYNYAVIQYRDIDNAGSTGNNSGSRTLGLHGIDSF